jgi:hypothetical protein
MITEPKRTDSIPIESQWLSGSVGSGSWFFIEKETSNYRIIRYSPDGIIECRGIFNTKKNGFEIGKPYRFTFLSHCKECAIIQNEIIYKFYNNEY